MTFEIQEESRYLGLPVNIYLFRFGSAPNAFYAYTDADEIITYQTIQYKPLPILRPEVRTSGTLDKTTLEITVAANSEIANLFIAYPPSSIINVLIRQGHLQDPNNEFLIAWSGRVLSCSRSGNEATLTCEPIATSLKRPGLRRNYQYGCPHPLYGEPCNANKAAATITRPIAGVTGSIIGLASGWNTQPVAKYVNGLIQWTDALGNTQLRTILGTPTATSILLSGDASILSVGQNIQISLGCNRTMSDCLNLHNNIANFGGHPFIPKKNPIKANNNEYY